MTTATPERAIAAFTADFPRAAVTPVLAHQVRRALVDTVACAIGGAGEPAARIAREATAGLRGPLEARVWIDGTRLPVEAAAMVNGICGHVLDFDDVTSPMRGHPSIALLPALVALAEARGHTIDDLCDAYCVGFEVLCKLSKAVANDHYAKGWHTTSTLGMLAAAVACARMLGLCREGVLDTLGLAVAQAAGTRENFGSMAKSFQAGHCNASALRAALLAARGFTGSAEALTGPRGFLTLYCDGQAVAEQLASLGRAPLELESSGIEIKKYPMCYATHRTLDGLLELRATHGLTLENVRAVDIVTSHRAMVPLIHDRPQTGLAGKFSMHYAVAAALADGHVRLSSFSDEAVLRPEIQAFFPNVRVRDVPGQLLPRWAEIAVTTRDGATFKARVETLRGSSAAPLSDDEIVAKLGDCCVHAGLSADTTPWARAALAPGPQRMAALVDRLASIGAPALAASA